MNLKCTAIQIGNKIQLFIGLVCLFAAASGHAQSSMPTGYQLKADYLYDFANFIEWPPETYASKNSLFIIGVLGQNPFGSILQQRVAGKKINGHPIAMESFKTVPAPYQCQILFVSNSEKKHLPDILRALNGTHVLTVSELDHFIQQGGAIQFIEQTNRVHFDINAAAAKSARLIISSKLLRLSVAHLR